MSDDFKKIERPDTPAEISALSIFNDLHDLNNKFGIILDGKVLESLRDIDNIIHTYLNSLEQSLKDLRKSEDKQ